MMKIQGWMIGCLLILTGQVFGQNEPPRFQESMARMKAERVSFLTDKLQLTAEEAEKFWPLYNEYLSKREEMMWGKRERMHRKIDPSQFTEEEMNTMLEDILTQEVKLAELKKEYFQKMRSVLTVKKVLTLHRVEQEFMNHMLNQIRESRNPGKPGGGNRDGFRTPRD